MISSIPGIKSIVFIIAVIALVVLAYRGDLNTSSGNTFALGEVDITIDNESYYNGTLNLDTTFSLRDLTIEKFFNFSDAKPNDYGEDTIGVRVELEDTFLCANVTLTSNNENGCNEPEGLVDASCSTPGVGEGELADQIEFMWWADDGDNVFESDETIISEGPIGALTVGVPLTLPLADSNTNIWTGVGGALPVGSELSIGKAWCFGEITPQALLQDGSDNLRNPSLDNDLVDGAGRPEDGGFVCEGEVLNNESQTDSLTADISFNAVQAFGNDGYLCSDGEPAEEEAEPESLFSDNFGAGNTDTTFNEAPGWEEGGAGAEKRNSAGGGDESIGDGDGGRKAAMSAPGGYICRSIDASLFHSLELFYFWRGDSDAEAGDSGIVEYATGGTCVSPTGLATLATHPLTTTTWQSNTVALPALLDGSTFFLRFRNGANTAGEDLRIDGVNLTGIPN